MRSAVLFFPPDIKIFKNFPTSLSRYRTSGRGSRWSKNLVLGMCHSLSRYQTVRPVLLRPLSSILRTALLSIRHTDSIESASDDVVPHTRQVLHTTATDEHNGMLLKVVTNTGDVCRDLHPVRQPDTRNFTQRRVRFLGR